MNEKMKEELLQDDERYEMYVAECKKNPEQFPYPPDKPTEKQKKCAYCDWWMVFHKKQPHTLFCRKTWDWVSTDKCKDCTDYVCKYIEFPITINNIDCEPIDIEEDSYLYRHKVGKFVRVRPCDKSLNGKTFLGVFLGELPQFNYVSHNKKNKTIKVEHMSNPAMFVFALNKIVFGSESWWSVIETPDDLSDITDDTIDSQFYMQMLKEITHPSDKPKEQC